MRSFSVELVGRFSGYGRALCLRELLCDSGVNAVAAAWGPPGDGIAVDYYRVAAIDPAGHAAASTIVPAATTTAVLTGQPAGDGWSVQVVAVNGLGAGSASTSDPFTITGAISSYSSQVLADAPGDCTENGVTGPTRR